MDQQLTARLNPVFNFCELESDGQLIVRRVMHPDGRGVVLLTVDGIVKFDALEPAEIPRDNVARVIHVTNQKTFPHRAQMNRELQDMRQAGSIVVNALVKTVVAGA